MESRLSAVFRGNGDYVNREFTLPASVEGTPLFASRIYREDLLLRRKVDELLRVVVHPRSTGIKNGVLSDVVKILESPYECGRVLEHPDRATIDGHASVLSVKWVGTTGFFRDTQAIGPWHFRHGKDKKTAAAMRTRTYYEDRWVFHRADAEATLSGYETLRSFGMETEIPLAIFRLSALPDKHGDMKGIAALKKSRHLHEEVDPVLYVRSSRSNFRVLDPSRMDASSSFWDRLPDFFDHALSEFRSHYDETASFQNYAEWLFHRMVSSETRLALSGVSHGGERWEDFCRNWSVLWEILDLDDVRVRTPEESDFYRLNQGLERQIGMVVVGARHFCNAYLRTGRTLDFANLAGQMAESAFSVCAAEAERIGSDYDVPVRPGSNPLAVRLLSKAFSSVFHTLWCDHESNTLQPELRSVLSQKYEIAP